MVGKTRITFSKSSGNLLCLMTDVSLSLNVLANILLDIGSGRCNRFLFEDSMAFIMINLKTHQRHRI